MDNTGQPCPRCGGHDRFVLIAQPRKGGKPFRLCRQCHHIEVARGSNSDATDTGDPGSSRRLEDESIRLEHEPRGIRRVLVRLRQRWVERGALPVEDTRSTLFHLLAQEAHDG